MSSMYKIGTGSLFIEITDIWIIMGFVLLVLLCNIAVIKLLKEKDFLWD